MRDATLSSHNLRLPVALVAWLLIASAVVGLLLAHTAERSHASEAITVSDSGPSAISFTADPVTEYSSAPAGVPEVLGFGEIDGGLLCAALAIGCVIALIAASFLNPARLGGILTLLPRPERSPVGPASPEVSQATSPLTAPILRL